MENLKIHQYHDYEDQEEHKEFMKKLSVKFDYEKNDSNDDGIRIKPIPVVTVNPDPDYILKKGDIIYGFGRIDK